MRRTGFTPAWRNKVNQAWLTASMIACILLARLKLSAYELTCRRRYGQTCRGVERPDEYPAGHGKRARRAFTPATFKTEKRR